MNVHVLTLPALNKMAVYRGNLLLALVDAGEGDPEVNMVAPMIKAYLSFGDMDIIQDNWNQMQEMIRTQS